MLHLFILFKRNVLGCGIRIYGGAFYNVFGRATRKEEQGCGRRIFVAFWKKPSFKAGFEMYFVGLLYLPDQW